MRRLIPYAGMDSSEGQPRLNGEACGYYERSPNPRIAVTFEQGQFDAVLEYAKGKSFAKAVRELVALGLRSKQSMTEKP